jgi:hypothetical protein
MVHLYLVIVEDPAEASVMLLHSVPEDFRVPGDYPAEGSGSVQGEKA